MASHAERRDDESLQDASDEEVLKRKLLTRGFHTDQVGQEQRLLQVCLMHHMTQSKSHCIPAVIR
jgi:hypothetical protein